MKKVESEEHAALIREFNHLERDWKSLQNSRPSRPRTPSSHLLQTSPRTLMSSLQHRNPRLLRVDNTYNNAVQEILMDRRAAISSGRFKGRQLFGITTTTSGEEGEDSTAAGQRCSECMHGCDEKRDELPFPEEEKTVVEVAEKTSGGGDGTRKKEKGGGGFAKACLAIVLFVIAFAFVSMSCNGCCVKESSILVPT